MPNRTIPGPLRRLLAKLARPAQPAYRCAWPDCADTCPPEPRDRCAIGGRPPGAVR